MRENAGKEAIPGKKGRAGLQLLRGAVTGMQDHGRSPGGLQGMKGNAGKEAIPGKKGHAGRIHPGEAVNAGMPRDSPGQHDPAVMRGEQEEGMMAILKGHVLKRSHAGEAARLIAAWQMKPGGIMPKQGKGQRLPKTIL
jgi:hypothetical protein